ncbi:hypothetical protein AWJ20_2070 [Sugiyamaella lignohabitans]|uniref:Uncharacterized protein n=1 Tax=Sugiyamaella lignohabitans TaxID=796027 RepID=A0A167EUL7_9ASCO|nr:uncharacterized protein AWJ20_2070 [Sugiyamaella lignohabitans]ANB14478.1 hypothetical protein AWJ20_2070 [Sugiyamaella lignohabitans]
MASGAKYRPQRWRREARGLEDSFSKLNIEGESHAEADAKARARRERFSQPAKKEEYGLISRGEDNRLRVDSKARRTYFYQTQLRALKIIAASTSQRQYIEDVLKIVDHEVSDSYQAVDTNGRHQSSDTDSEDSVLMSLRKLREALLPIEPDKFTKQVFLFSVRMAVLAGKYQAFIPSVLYILDVIHPVVPLSFDEFRQVALLHVYHTAHFSNDVGTAYKTLYHYLPDDKRAWTVLQALASNNFVSWVQQKRTEPDLWLRLSLDQNHATMAKNAIPTISKSYMKLHESSIERLLGLDWNTLTSNPNIGCVWPKDSTGTATIRQRKTQS